MKRFLVLYATRQGQARKVAEFVLRLLREPDNQVTLHDVRSMPRAVDLGGFDAVVLVASVHLGSHEREMTSFVKRNRAALQARSTAFLSVSLAQASAESRLVAPEKRAAAVRDAETAIARFCLATSFRPDRVMPVAGALAYSKYGPVVRCMMRRIAMSAEMDHDSSRDHEYTDWSQIRKFVEAFTPILDARPLGVASPAHPGTSA